FFSLTVLLLSFTSFFLFFFFLIIRRPPRSTLFPTRRSSDLQLSYLGGSTHSVRSPQATLALPAPSIVEGSEQSESKGAKGQNRTDRKSTRLNSSHVAISYAVFCLKKKKKKKKKKRK